MKATGALPTEDRVKQMNDPQWLWYYMNLLEDEKDEEKKWKARLDYLTIFINPQLAKSVREQKEFEEQHINNIQHNINNNEPAIVKSNTTVNNEFEEEMQKALADTGSDESFTVLPSSDSVGNPLESEQDFLKRVMQNQEINQQSSFVDVAPISKPIFSDDIQETIGNVIANTPIDPNDIDYFEYPE